VLYKATVNELEKVVENKHAIPQELADQKYGHIGGIDYYDGVLYGGIEISKSEPGVIAAWNATDLSLLRWEVTAQNGMPWVAADGVAGLLYSTHWSDTGRINVFDMTTFQQRDDLTIRPASEAPADQFPPEIQGAAFYERDPGFLFLAANGAESVYKVDIASGALSFVLSDKQYRSHEAEMEGLTFWDLGARGVMHMFSNFERVVQKGLHSYLDMGGSPAPHVPVQVQVE